jgi:hypothetical protein
VRAGSVVWPGAALRRPCAGLSRRRDSSPTDRVYESWPRNDGRRRRRRTPDVRSGSSSRPRASSTGARCVHPGAGVRCSPTPPSAPSPGALRSQSRRHEGGHPGRRPRTRAGRSSEAGPRGAWAVGSRPHLAPDGAASSDTARRNPPLPEPRGTSSGLRPSRARIGSGPSSRCERPRGDPTVASRGRRRPLRGPSQQSTALMPRS